MKYKGIVLVISLLILTSCGNTKGLSDKEDQEEIFVFLCIGQSNMAGRAEIMPKDTLELKNVFLFNDSSKWEIARNPLNRYSTIRKEISMQKLGPGYFFARMMADTQKGSKIGLVVNAKGGTKIDLWKPNAEFYNEAVQRTQKAMEFGNLKGVLWLQGESDSNNYEAYLQKLVNFIVHLRSDLNLPDLPFIAGQISNDKLHRSGFNEMILELPTKLDHVSVITSENTSTIDGTHFDAASQRIIGERYAKEMIKLLKLN
jgi:hypothetical protein